MMKLFRLAIAITLAAACFAGCSAPDSNKEQEEVASSDTSMQEASDTLAAQPDTIKGSIPSEVSGNIGSAHVTIKYSSPGVKDRLIWGGLVPYGQIWVTGAHMATTLETDKALMIDGKDVPAGKYALFTIPNQDEWTFIINKNWDQHQADKYDKKDDVLRMRVTPVKLGQHQERLKYEIVESADAEGALKILWEKRGITIPVRAK